jgi:hypothetical protein
MDRTRDDWIKMDVPITIGKHVAGAVGLDPPARKKTESP